MHLSLSRARDHAAGSGWRARLRAAAILSAMSVVLLNLVTGSPLMAIWLGARVQGAGPPTMAAFFTFLGSFAAFSFLLVRLFAGLSRAYNELTGRRPTVREHLPWLRSLRGERPAEMGSKAGLSPLDLILVFMVLAAILAFEIWFFFYSGSPIDERTGRV